jgi:NADPH2:quinone reductase
MSTLPATMTAIEIASPGGPEVLRVATRPVPEPGEGEVLVRVEAAGVNRPDVLQRQGLYRVPPGASDLPGLEVAGTVAAVGPGVTEPAVGDRVCALTPGGGYAQYCRTPAGHCLPFPRGYDAVRAGALPETFFTVWINVFQRATLGRGETLLVQGGSSGIGTTAIQLAAALGHRVFATAGTDEKCRACEQLGAERGINYRSEDFVEVVKSLTGGRGVDVILDMVGGDYVPRELKALADDGRLSIIAFLGGTKATLDMSDILYRRLTITGSTLRPRSVAFKTSVALALRAHVWPMLDAGRVSPVIHAEFPLEEAARAHALMETSTHVGKIMLRVA